MNASIGKLLEINALDKRVSRSAQPGSKAQPPDFSNFVKRKEPLPIAQAERLDKRVSRPAQPGSKTQPPDVSGFVEKKGPLPITHAERKGGGEPNWALSTHPASGRWAEDKDVSGPFIEGLENETVEENTLGDFPAGDKELLDSSKPDENPADRQTQTTTDLNGVVATNPPGLVERTESAQLQRIDKALSSGKLDRGKLGNARNAAAAERRIDQQLLELEKSPASGEPPSMRVDVRQIAVHEPFSATLPAQITKQLLTEAETKMKGLQGNSVNSRDPITEIELRLQPRELGNIRIRMIAIGDRLKIDIFPTNDNAAASLNSARSFIQGKLETAGYTMESLYVSMPSSNLTRADDVSLSQEGYQGSERTDQLQANGNHDGKSRGYGRRNQSNTDRAETPAGDTRKSDLVRSGGIYI